MKYEIRMNNSPGVIKYNTSFGDKVTFVNVILGCSMRKTEGTDTPPSECLGSIVMRIGGTPEKTLGWDALPLG